MTHHDLDSHPMPKDKLPLYINEPSLIDKSLEFYPQGMKVDDKKDNVRVYIPLDLNKDAILRRLDRVINEYGETSEENEMEFSIDVGMLVSQIEIYDQVWYVRHMPPKGEHSLEAMDLVRAFVAKLEEIPDACAEWFPFDLIDQLREEYLSAE